MKCEVHDYLRSHQPQFAAGYRHERRHLNVRRDQHTIHLTILDENAITRQPGLALDEETERAYQMIWAAANDSFNRSTFQRPERPTARVRLARNTPNTKSHNTRLARYDSRYGQRPSVSGMKDANAIYRLPSSPKERDVMTESSPVTVVRQSQSSTRRLRQPRKSC